MKKNPIILILSILGLVFFTHCQKEPLSSGEAGELSKNQINDLTEFSESTDAQEKRGKGPKGTGEEKDSLEWRITLEPSTGNDPILSGSLDFRDEVPNRKDDNIIIADYNNAQWTMYGINSLDPVGTPVNWGSCFDETEYVGGMEIRHGTGLKKTDKAWIIFDFTNEHGDYCKLYLYSTFQDDSHWIPNDCSDPVITITTRLWRMDGDNASCSFAADPYNQDFGDTDSDLEHTMTIEVVDYKPAGGSWGDCD